MFDKVDFKVPVNGRRKKFIALSKRLLNADRLCCIGCSGMKLTYGFKCVGFRWVVERRSCCACASHQKVQERGAFLFFLLHRELGIELSIMFE